MDIPKHWAMSDEPNFEQMSSDEVRAYYMIYPIELDKVTSVYSGKHGCACGCRGKYTYASQTRESESSAARLSSQR